MNAAARARAAQLEADDEAERVERAAIRERIHRDKLRAASMRQARALASLAATLRHHVQRQRCTGPDITLSGDGC